MRHRVYGKHFGRNKNQRQTLFKGLVRQLLSYGTIQTSEIKAKAIKGLVDKIINSQIKKGILPKIENRTSGYASIARIGPRLGDQTVMVRMSLIEADKLKPVVKESRKKQETKKVVKKEVSKEGVLRAMPVPAKRKVAAGK